MVTKVGVVDDSVIARTVLEDIINDEPGFKVVGKAGDPFQAREMIFERKPDILTLDVEMPRLDGISFLKSLMENFPLPVVMVSSLTERSSKKGMRALELGAVDIVCKPGGDSRDSLRSLADDLIPKLKAAAKADVKKIEKKKKKKKDLSISLPSKVDGILIGSSTGGTKALRKVFKDLSSSLPPILICQHMPPVFTTHFSKGLNEISNINIREAEPSDEVKPGEALLAPGDYHMVVSGHARSRGIPVELNQDEEVNFQRPAVDPLFESAAKYLKGNIVSVVLTGMGKDGRDGARQLEKAGATVLVQDEETSTVYGMPKQVKNNVKSAQEFALQDLASILEPLAS